MVSHLPLYQKFPRYPLGTNADFIKVQPGRPLIYGNAFFSHRKRVSGDLFPTGAVNQDLAKVRIPGFWSFESYHLTSWIRRNLNSHLVFISVILSCQGALQEAGIHPVYCGIGDYGGIEVKEDGSLVENIGPEGDVRLVVDTKFDKPTGGRLIHIAVGQHDVIELKEERAVLPQPPGVRVAARSGCYSSGV